MKKVSAIHSHFVIYFTRSHCTKEQKIVISRKKNTQFWRRWISFSAPASRVTSSLVNFSKMAARFQPPEIQDNPTGWGPNTVPPKFKDMPYQPFSKSDRLGKVRRLCTSAKKSSACHTLTSLVDIRLDRGDLPGPPARQQIQLCHRRRRHPVRLLP